jgi:putative FmdB family regulatory protein
MPIYAYKCESCGHRQDALQKMSDPVLTVCPACGASTFAKQVTAAGFQLKGSGWYATDFRDGGKAPKKDAPAEGGGTDTPAKDVAKPETGTPAVGNAAASKTATSKAGDAKAGAPSPAASPPPASST